MAEENDSSLQQLREEHQQLFALMNIKTKKLEEALSDLRIHVKYLLFENEALTRENQYLQELLTQDDRQEFGGPNG